MNICQYEFQFGYHYDYRYAIFILTAMPLKLSDIRISLMTRKERTIYI